MDRIISAQMNNSQCYTTQDATIIIVNGKPYKVILDIDSSECVRGELKCLEDVGIFGDSIVQCKTIQVISTNIV